MARKRIDARTKTMSTAALTCRTLGHCMVQVPVKPERRSELRKLGQYAIRVVCLRGCSRWREQVFDDATDEYCYSKGDYTDKDSYLVQARGTGRLPRTAARAAFRRAVAEPQVPESALVAAAVPAAKKVPAKKAAPARRAQAPRQAARARTGAPPVAFSS